MLSNEEYFHIIKGILLDVKFLIYKNLKLIMLFLMIENIIH